MKRGAGKMAPPVSAVAVTTAAGSKAAASGSSATRFATPVGPSKRATASKIAVSTTPTRPERKVSESRRPVGDTRGDRFARPEAPSRRQAVVRRQYLSRSQDSLTTVAGGRKPATPWATRPKSVLVLSKEAAEGRGASNKENQKGGSGTGGSSRSRGSRPPISIRKAVSSVAINHDMSTKEFKPQMR
ncbi:PREDICTED: uncharacterized protein LOC106819802 [Priapulus caudatus]|uniref:Uncharacterized protein LOC106819802 n=1 Tax=Priapulus caudatus TaxID=37621 RepID=A0ABM1F602_PRICU|nr:PREDICTED: uncharacterized protein LOC106819802 [Priapulus caudatus]